MKQRAIPATLMRGGTSRGLYFHAQDLPRDPELRDAVLLAAMGSPNPRQIDGIGGAHPLTSKVAVLSRSSREDADVDYLFLQVAVDAATVSDGQNCGNILAGVGPWAIEHGLVVACEGTTDVRIHMLNSGSVAVATVCTPGSEVDYEGDARIDGVPGTAAPVPLAFLDVAGSVCGALLPSGSVIDTVDGVELTCIDNGMPVVLIRAADLGKTGHESPADLESDATLAARVESLRLAVGERMNLGDVTSRTVPKMCLIAAPTKGGALSTRSFIPHRVHEAIGVLGAVSVATACVLPGSVADGIADVASTGAIEVEHPSGSFTVALEIEIESESESGSGSGSASGSDRETGTVRVTRSALLRTARKLFSGEVHVPARLFESSPR